MKNREENEKIVLPKGCSPETLKKDIHAKTEMSKRIERIVEEFEDGFELINKYPKSVSFFGSHTTTEDEPYYQQARMLAKRVSEEGFAVITGGGEGIMEAANTGAHEAEGHSIGLNIDLPQEEPVNSFVSDNLVFHYFFSRKTMLSFSAEAYVFFPGGVGTMDEFFEIVTLVKTGRIPEVPILCFEREYWEAVDRLIKETFLEKYKTVVPGDRDIYTICDDIEEAVSIIKKAPLRKED